MKKAPSSNKLVMPLFPGKEVVVLSDLTPGMNRVHSKSALTSLPEVQMYKYYWLTVFFCDTCQRHIFLATEI